MNRQIEDVRKTRFFLLDMIGDLNTDQLNLIPAGFNNNIIWNLGHLVAAQQRICYDRAGLPVAVEEHFFNLYKPGTKPEQYVGLAETEHVKQLLFSSLDKLEEDIQAGVFQNYPAWTTRYKVEITGIDDILAFLPYHEGLHGGYITAMKKLVKP